MAACEIEECLLLHACGKADRILQYNLPRLVVEFAMDRQAV
jgi:hypothetical protein